MFSIAWDQARKVPPHNLITIRPLRNHISANIVVKLDGMDLPVSLLLDADSRNEHGLRPKEIDGTLALKLLQRGPSAKLPSVGPVSQPAIYPLLYKFLYDTPPNGAEQVTLSPALGKAWVYDNKLYFRTDKPLRWPAWSGQSNAPGGTSVYEMQVVPLLMLSVDGETINVTVDISKSDADGVAYGK